jgi:hypothetical protein
MSQQGLRQAVFRSIGSTAGTLEQDMLAAFAASVPSRVVGTFDERFMLWLQDRLSSSDTNLAGLMQAYAASKGATNWSSLGTFTP